MLNIQHGSLGSTRDIEGERLNYTLYGPETEIKAEYEKRQIGSAEPDENSYPGFTLQTASPKPDTGNGWWLLDLNYRRRTGSDGGPTAPGIGPTESELNVRTMELPLEAKRTAFFKFKYRTKWNWMLMGKGPIDPATKKIIPPPESEWLAAWNAATDITALTDNDFYRWTKDPNDRPGKENGFGWSILKDKTKPGVESFLWPTVEITERGFHNNQFDAAWVVSFVAERKTPTLGTYGLKTGDWLCMGGPVSRQGGFWVAQCSYMWSPDGWDTDFYK